MRTPGRRDSSADDDPRDRADRRDGAADLCAAHGELPARARLLGLARPRAAAHTTGGKPRLGRISKIGQRDLRRLLITGAMAVVSWAVRRGETRDPWLARMLARKPRKLVAVALANRMARIIWALMNGRRRATRHPPSPERAAKAGSRRGCEQVGGRVRANGRSRRDREIQSRGQGPSSPEL